MLRLLLIAFTAEQVAQGIGFAQASGLPFDIVSFDRRPEDGTGAASVFFAESNTTLLPDALVSTLAPFLSHYSHFAAVSSMQAKDGLARFAGKFDLAMVTDAIEMISPTTFKRPVVAGSIIATVEVQTTPVVITFRPSGFPKPADRGPSKYETLQLETVSRVTRVSSLQRGGTRPDLSVAKVIVSGGRPLKDTLTFETLIGGLADALGGAAGATRAAVDSGIAPNDLQVGQTGKIVAPDLYIAAGISGSTQHMAGIKDSKIIVAINKDGNAPIFEVADYGVVADLFDAIPEFQKGLGK